MPKPKGETEYGIMEEEATEKFVLLDAMNLQRGQVVRASGMRGSLTTSCTHQRSARCVCVSPRYSVA